MPLLLVFESIGTQELVLIVLAALLLFGPRKLPELGRKFGKTLAEFRRASEDFKRTWQMEVEIEEAQKQRQTAETTPVAADTSANTSSEQEELTEPPPHAAPPLVATPVDEAVARGSVHTTAAPSHDAATTDSTPRETSERASQLVS